MPICNGVDARACMPHDFKAYAPRTCAPGPVHRWEPAIHGVRTVYVRRGDDRVRLVIGAVHRDIDWIAGNVIVGTDKGRTVDGCPDDLDLDQLCVDTRLHHNATHCVTQRAYAVAHHRNPLLKFITFLNLFSCIVPIPKLENWPFRFSNLFGCVITVPKLKNYSFRSSNLSICIISAPKLDF